LKGILKMAENILEMKRVTKKYGGIKALDNVDFSIFKGEIHCLVGENGSGKSTLIKIISGVEKPEAGGEIFIDNIKETQLNPIKSIQKGVQVIYQDLSLFSNLTIWENIAIKNYFAKDIKFVNRKKMKDIAIKSLDKIRVKLDINKIVYSLSIADRQLVSICRAIATEAKIIIMDEPTASLDKHEIKSLFLVIKELQKKGMTILFVSHKLDEIMEISERVTVLRDGKKIGVFDSKDLDDKKISYLMTGKDFHYKTRSEKYQKGKVLLELENYSKKNNFKNISFTLHEGEVIGIIGTLGSGRTELALSIFGMNKNDSGRILIEGKELNIKSNIDAIRFGIGYLPEDRLSQGLIMEQSVENNIIITIFRKITNRMNIISNSIKKIIVQKWINNLNIKITNIVNPVKKLSGGNQQKVVIAKWLVTEPKILILDSPTTGVDIAAKEGIYKIIKELSDKKIGIIFISDEIPEILNNCHHIFLMRKGEIVARFTPDDISEKELNKRIVGDI
jgi:simple sugar transport system ATP-binding protein